MKIKTKITIPLVQYGNLRPEIEIDTENIEESKKTIRLLFDEFYNLIERDSRKDSQDDIPF